MMVNEWNKLTEEQQQNFIELLWAYRESRVGAEEVYNLAVDNLKEVENENRR